MRHTAKILFAILVGTGLTHPLQAQRVGHPSAPGRPTRVPVTLALVDSLSDGAPFRILRRAGASPADVIVFRMGADSTALSEAMNHLLVMRRVQGDTARSGGAVRVRRPQSPQHRPPALPWAKRVMDDLHHAERTDVAGVGSARTVQVWLPPQRGRRTQQ